MTLDSMSLKSIVIAATLRVSRTRPPLAVTSICSPTLEPLKSSASAPDWPSTLSLPSPGSHWKRSSPEPSSARVGADVAVDVVVAVAADQRVRAVAAADVVAALAAVERQRGERADAVLADERVGAAETLDVRLSTAMWLTPAKPVANVATASVPLRGDADRVVAVGALGGRAVGAVAAVDVHLAGAGHARVAGDRVGVAERRHAGVVLRLGRRRPRRRRRARRAAPCRPRGRR